MFYSVIGRHRGNKSFYRLKGKVTCRRARTTLRKTGFGVSLTNGERQGDEPCQPTKTKTLKNITNHKMLTLLTSASYYGQERKNLDAWTKRPSSLCPQ
jgi:hypothetical protein